MDKIQLLQSRKAELMKVGKGIRENINSIIDENSFVELSAFSFSKNDFYGETAEGEGVVTGYATIDGFPFYIVAQNFAVSAGGISKANCDKICKCLDQAEKNSTPVLYVLQSNGVQVGEGVTVLEGLAKLLLKVTQLKGVVPQYVVVNGALLGSAALIAAEADFTFFTEKSVLAVNSPVVLSAKAGKNLKAEEVGGAKALDKTNIPSFEVKDLTEVRELVAKLNSLLLIDREEVDEAVLNDSLPELNQAVTANGVLKAFESCVEVGAGYASDVKTVLGRMGGVAVAAVVVEAEEGVKLTAQKMKKVKDFAELACCYDLPFITFTDTLGVCPCLEANNSTVLKETAEYLSMLDAIDTAKIAVVYKKAIGLGYSLFAAKSVGFDYTVAFANAKIALFDSVQGAEIEFGKSDEKIVERYADENSDPVNAAKDGYIDAVIEPQFVKQYLVAALQMLTK
ncbi:MAG: hypothetical protein J6Z36_03545 [Clostridia bacterium]|nr:hypothetical protein [Clostridia bacterium]